MIRWYDYIAAILFADVLMVVALTVPFFGFIIAYAMYEIGWDGYCQYRKENEQ